MLQECITLLLFLYFSDTKVHMEMFPALRPSWVDKAYVLGELNKINTLESEQSFQWNCLSTIHLGVLYWISCQDSCHYEYACTLAQHMTFTFA